jgi:small GTP-binding protein
MNSATQVTTLRTKCVLLGNSTVGKSSLVQTFMGKPFSKQYVMTTQSDISIKTVNIPDTNVSVELYLTDIGGNEMFLEYIPKYCKDATSFMLVFDTTQPDSFKDLQKWMNYLKHIKTLKNCKGILIATKLDETHRRFVTRVEAEDFATKYNLAYFETSVSLVNKALEQNVDAPFFYLAHTFQERFGEFLRATKKACEGL